MANELQTSVVESFSIAPTGKKVTDRRMAAVDLATHAASLSLIAADGGKVGKYAAQKNTRAALVDMAGHCANSNYKPLAEYIAARTGKVTTIDRHVFHALPTLYLAAMHDLESTGKAVSATTGKNSAAYNMASELHTLCSQLLAASEEIRARRAAEKAERDAAKAAELTAQICAEMDRIDAEVLREASEANA